MQCGVKRLVKGWVVGEGVTGGRVAPITGHQRTWLDMTGHNRTQPDTKPDIPDMGTRDTVQNTPDTTGHYRTLLDTTGH